VYAWNAGGAEIPNDEAWNLNYSGYYIEENLSFDTQDRWDLTGSPSDADGYVGCPVDVDNHSFSYKRKGFPEGNYTINVDGHDDAAQLFVNGTNVWEHNGCCDSHPAVWEGILGADDEVEFRVTEAFSGSLGKLSFVECPGDDIVFVKADATGDNNGTSWEHAFNDLQDGIATGFGCAGVTQVWVAAGTYKPTSGDDRSKSFEMRNNLAIYGGFEGTEDPQTFNLADRNFITNETILSGDIGVQNDSTDNSQNVVRSNNNDNTAMLDGFTIRQGQADLGVGRGGGVLVINGTTVIKNCHITDNYALGGAGISIEGINAQPTLQNCTLEGNRSLGGGGGAIVGFGAKPVFETCTFSGNQGGLGGGVSVFSNGSNPVFNNCIFQGNTSLDNGGGVSSIAEAMPAFNNCSFTQNTAAGNGGGVYSTGNPISFNDCSFSQNSAVESGGGIYGSGLLLTFNNCEFTQNSTDGFGGAINGLIELIITDCLFEGNSAPDAVGGAINFGNSPGTISGTSFINNSALGAGAIGHFAFAPNSITTTLTNCNFHGNTATSGGGAIFNGFSNTEGSVEMNFEGCTFRDNSVFDGTDQGAGGAILVAKVGHNVTLTNCLLDGNNALGTADIGGGAILAFEGMVTVVNSTLVNNGSATQGGAASVSENGAVSFKNSILWNNAAVTDNSIYNGEGGVASAEYSLIHDDMCPANVTCGDGMLYNIDPLFADVTDYHLQPCSPVIDAGTNDGAPGTDLDGNPRPFSPGGFDPAMTDMGCYEYSISEDLCATCTTVAFAGEDAVILAGETYTLADATAENYTGLAWSTSGDGTFDDENAVNPTYFPGPDDNNNGSVILTLSLEGLSSCGTGDTDAMTLMLNSPPTVEILSPMEGDLLYSNPVAVEGTAADVDGNLAEVYVMVNDGDWMLANGTETWDGELTLVPGENQIMAKAVDAQGLESDVEMVTVTLSVQVIPLSEGWSIISSYLNPVEPDMAMVMSNVGIPGNIVFMNGKSGILWPEFGINTIGDWNVFEGYKVKVVQPDELIIGGNKLADNSVSFGPGFHYIPVLSDMPAPIDEVFADPENDIVYLFDQATTQIYWPDGGIFTLEELTPGRGYPASFLNDVTLNFPDYQNLKSSFIPEGIVQSNDAPWNFAKTGNYHQVSISRSALESLEGVEYIGAFDANGICVGASKVDITTGNILLTVYGDDPISAEKDGALESEILTFKAHQPGNPDLELSPVFSTKMPESTGRYADNGLSMITGFKATSTGFGEGLARISVELFPNPARETVTLVCPDYTSLGKWQVEFVNTGGELVEKVKLTGQSTSINLERFARGVYFVKVTSQNTTVIEKLVIK
jgi:predicted outer membrane repeat protein